MMTTIIIMTFFSSSLYPSKPTDGKIQRHSLERTDAHLIIYDNNLDGVPV